MLLAHACYTIPDQEGGLIGLYPKIVGGKNERGGGLCYSSFVSLDYANIRPSLAMVLVYHV